MIGIPVRLPEMRKPIRRVRVQPELVRGKRKRVRIQPVAIRADFPDRLDQAHPGTGGDAVAEPMVRVALCAVLLVERRTARGDCLVDGVGIFRRRQRPDPVAHALQAVVIDGDRRHAGAECGTQVALVHRIVVAVPMQVHAFARLLIPQRRKIRCADQLVGRQLPQVPVELHGLVWVEGVDAAPSPPRHAVGQDWRDAVP